MFWNLEILWCEGQNHQKPDDLRMPQPCLNCWKIYIPEFDFYCDWSREYTVTCHSNLINSLRASCHWSLSETRSSREFLWNFYVTDQNDILPKLHGTTDNITKHFFGNDWQSIDRASSDNSNVLLKAHQKWKSHRWMRILVRGCEPSLKIVCSI